MDNKEEIWNELWIKAHEYLETYHYVAHLGDIKLLIVEIGWRDDADGKPQPLMQFELYKFSKETLEWVQDPKIDYQILGVDAAKQFAQDWYVQNIYSDYILLEK